MKRILVSGGAGFIGSNLCRKLLENGEHVICLDNLFTGSKGNIDSLPEYPEFEFLDQDITQRFDIKVDEIYNLACPASAKHYQKNPVQTLKTSVLGTMNLLEIAKRHGAKILQASTSEVYGNPQVHPQSENYYGNVNTVGIRSCYNEGKRCAETFMDSYSLQYGLNTKIVRIFNTYGVNMKPDDGRVISNFIVQALRGENLTIYGNGSQTRAFCYIDDLIDGLIKMMNSDMKGPVNFGNPSEKTILDIAKLIIELSDSKSGITFTPSLEYDPVRRQPDIKLAVEKLGWKPKIDLREGLKRTINYFKEKIK